MTSIPSIIDIGRADDFIEALCALIKNLRPCSSCTCWGIFFDRGPRPD